MQELGSNDLEFELDDPLLAQQMSAAVNWYALSRGPLGVDRRHLPDGIGTRPGERTTFAGPIHVARRRVRGKESLFAYPIFLVHASSRRDATHIEFTMEGDVQVNLAWLENVFSRDSDDLRDDVLIRLGLLREDANLDHTPLVVRNLADCWQALRDRVTEFSWIGTGNLQSPSSATRLDGRSLEGIHSSMLALREDLSSFTKGLTTDLREIAKATDEELSRSALMTLLPRSEPPPASHGAPRVPAQASTLNASQQEVVELALNDPLVVVQGPPGTGKSTVVRSTMVSLGINGGSAVFSSMNHKAVNAVVHKLNEAAAVHKLVADLREKDRWTQLLQSHLAVQQNEELLDVPELQRALISLDEESRHALRLIEDALTDGDRLIEANERVAEVASRRSGWSTWITTYAPPLAPESLRAMMLRRAEASPAWRRLWARISLWLALRRARASWPLNESPAAEDLLDAVTWHREALLAKDIERRLHESQPLDELGEKAYDAQHKGAALVAKALPRLPAAWAGSIRDRAGIVSRIAQGATGGGHQSRKNRLDAECQHLASLLPGLPLWAITSLSVFREIPRVAGAFDLAIIDEAGQCQPASALPLLFRSKRAMFVGDPKQLRPIVGISRAKQDGIRRRHGMEGEEFDHLMFAGRSAYDLAEGALYERGGEARLLREHYRCHPDIAEFFNEQFYEGRLQIRTSGRDAQQRHSGIRWTDVPGGSTTAGSSRWHPPQVTAIVNELRRLADDGFDGTVGVVTPFREHAKRVRDAAFRALGGPLIKRWQFISDTADGFQGGERDVILFGLVGGGTSEPVTPRFYMSDHNRFNVAVSRARIQLHVVGDREWARHCPVPVLNKLVEASEASQGQRHDGIRTDLIGPVWEPRLAEELLREGLDFHQQYPTCGSYLDFAFLPSSGTKINVEVDGETYHRDRDGNLRAEDVRRDLVLRANGWRVKRFWVYELREDMASCIRQIKALL